MKIQTIVTALALAAAIALAGCQNTFTGSGTNTSVLSDLNSANNTNLGSINITSVTGTLVNYYNQLVTITFGSDDNIDVSSIPAGLTIYSLSNSTGANVPYIRSVTPITYTIDQVSGNTVRLNLNLNGSNALLEFYFNSTLLTGRNGVLKMDYDGDDVQGEGSDDDVYRYLSVGTYDTLDPVAVTIGCQRNPRVYMNLDPVATGFSASAGTTDTYRLAYDRAYDGATDTNTYKTLFDSCVLIEEFDEANDEWDNVTYNSTYEPASGIFTATFAGAAEGSVYRARLRNRASLVTISEYNGFRQRYSMDAKEVVRDEIITGPTAAVFSTTPLQMTEGDQDDALIVTVISDAADFNVAVKLTLDLSITGNRGLDTATITSDNLKIWAERTITLNGTDYTTRVEMPYTVAYQRTSTAYPAVDNIILLKLDPSYELAADTFELRVGPGLKTLGDTGVGVIPRYFGSSTSLIDNDPKWIGFLALDSDGETL